MLSLRDEDVGSYDERTWARLEREKKETIKGLRALRAQERIRKDQTSKFRKTENHEDGKALEGVCKEVDESDERSKENEVPTNHEYTKLSKLKRLQRQKEEEARKKCLRESERRKFIASLMELRTSLQNQEWNHFCHLKQRLIQRENNRLKTITRIRWKYEINEILPPDSIVFDKIIRYKRERKKEMMIRKKRMLDIIEKIGIEMSGGICVLRKTESAKRESKKYMSETTIGELYEGNLSEFTNSEDRIIMMQENEKTEENNKVLQKASEKKMNDKNITKHVFESAETEVKEQKLKSDEDRKLSKAETDVANISTEGIIDLEAIMIVKKGSRLVDLPKDNFFYSNPSIVIFENFNVNKKYNRKVVITNKTPKWAYLRYNKIDTEIWEPGVIEVDALDAARIRPGLQITINVKFSPVNEEEILAEVSFLTLSPDDPTTFHELRIPVHCTPESPVPVVDPKEVRFPTAPIWKFDDPKFTEKVINISNDGGKSFSFLIGERNRRKDCFLWDFDEGEAQSVNSLASSINENEQEECDTEKDTELESRKQYQIEVPPKIRCRLRITFHPRYVGLHHEVLKIYFSANGNVFDEQNIPLWAEVTGSQIHLNPPCIDLGIITIDCEVSQQNFDVMNTGRSNVEVLMKTPKRLEAQVTVYPKSAIVQPETFCTVSVRLIPKSNIVKISKGYYDSTSSLLEFPIHVQTVTRDAEKPPPLILKVLATLTTCHSLILKPAFVDLGTVHTHESVFAELTLTNQSLLIQEYGFLNLPLFMEIQPNYGFGSILPGETIKLHLIYSACLTDIPGNEIGANGLTGERRFQIEAVTMAELSGNKKQINMSELTISKLENALKSRNLGVPPSISVQSELPEIISITNDFAEKDVTNASSNDHVDTDSVNSADEEDTDATTNIPKNIGHFGKSRGKKKNVIKVLAIIVDTFCELSEQILELPATPCGSFSMVSVELRGFNIASHPHCTCGILKNQTKEFTARYEFKSSSDRVKVVPQRGHLCSNNLVKVTFIFEPRLRRNAILEKARELMAKRITEEREARKLEKSQREDKPTRRKGKARRKEDRMDKEREKGNGEISDIDKLPGEISLLETFEPLISTIFVTCTIDVTSKDGTTHEETLFIKLICPIVKPEILILNVDREINFGPTAIGTVSRKHILVKNTSTRTVKVDVTLLNPFGPFFVAPGKTIETGSILKLPLSYRPTEDHRESVQEYFQVSDLKSRTIWRLRVKGHGVAPSWTINPKIGVARLEATDGKLVELKMTIRNTGACPLSFGLRIVDALRGNIPQMEEDGTTKRSKRGKTTGDEVKTKTSRRQQFSDALREHEEAAIHGGQLERLEDRSCFSLKNFDENGELVVRENEKVDFGIQFQPPKEVEEVKKKSSPRKKTKGLSKLDNVGAVKPKSNYCYVALLKLTLGSTTSVQDLVVICSIK